MNKKYLVKGGPVVGGNPQYRGIYRMSPTHAGEGSEYAKANESFFRSIEAQDEQYAVQDLQVLHELVHHYDNLNPSQKFEIIRVLESDEQPDNTEKFLGYDLGTTYHYSLLYFGLDFKEIQDGKAVSVLLKLIKEYFQPQLNQYGLFEDLSEAQFCLDCMMALQSFRPGLFENEEVIFEVIGVCLVTPQR